MRPSSTGVTVVGTATVPLETTHVRLTVAVESIAATAAPALDDNTAAAQRLLDAVSGAGVPPERVRTLGLTLDARWGEGDRITGHVARQRFVVEAPQVATISALLTDLGDRLGDRLRLENVEMGQQPSAEAIGASERDAFADALSRATQLAETAGRRLGEVRSVSVEPGDGRGPHPVAFKAASLAPGEGSLTTAVRVSWDWA